MTILSFSNTNASNKYLLQNFRSRQINKNGFGVVLSNLCIASCLCWIVGCLMCVLFLLCLCRLCWIVCWLCCLLTSGIRLWMLGSLPDHFSHTVPPPTFYQVSSTFVCLIFFLCPIFVVACTNSIFIRIFDTSGKLPPPHPPRPITFGWGISLKQILLLLRWEILLTLC